MNANQFNDALVAKGWKSVETAEGFRFTSPEGDLFIYHASEAVIYGTWFDVARCTTARLPSL